MHDCNSLYIISFYGAFISGMEFMDKGSLDGIYKQIGSIGIGVVGKVVLDVLEGPTYLYNVHRIVHRGECCTGHLALRVLHPHRGREQILVAGTVC